MESQPPDADPSSSSHGGGPAAPVAVKLRMTSLDVKAVVDELQPLVGMRLVNLYDLSPKLFLLKFGQGEKKQNVLFEAGTRMHATNLSREKPKIPSQFTLKLRKHVRSWRLDAVQQLGVDRVVVMRFGTGDQAHSLIFELYGQGNFVLTDASSTILMLLRSQKSEDVRLAVREPYPLSVAKQFKPHSRDDIVAALTQAQESQSLRQALPLNTYGTLLAEKVFAACGLRGAEKKRVWGSDAEALATRLAGYCAAVDAAFLQPQGGGGLLLRCDAPAAAAAAASAEGPEESVVYSEFWPACVMMFMEHQGRSRPQPTATFSEAVERVYLASERDKIQQHNAKKETAVLTKKEKFLRDHQRRIDGLMSEQDRNRRLGELIQLNVEDVDAAINLIRDTLATGISWDLLASVIRQRQAEGTHPVANIIHELKLHKNTISLLLTQECDDFDDEEGIEDADLAPVVVDVDISHTAFANASRYHTAKKQVGRKLEKTEAATDRAAAAAEAKGQRVAKKVGAAKQDITALRAPYWFEKFVWFISSAGHLVVSGHDAQQTDIIAKRYMDPADVFVHSEHPASIPCIVKNPAKGAVVAMASVEEAGIMCLSRTDAWRKNSMSAWWVQAGFVSKRAPRADFNLAAGQFAIYGTKTFMAAMQLQLAVAIVFRNATPAQAEAAAAAMPPCEGDDDDNFVRLASNEDLKAAFPASIPAAQAGQGQGQGGSNPGSRQASNDVSDFTAGSPPAADAASSRLSSIGERRRAQLRRGRGGHSDSPQTITVASTRTPITVPPGPPCGMRQAATSAAAAAAAVAASADVTSVATGATAASGAGHLTKHQRRKMERIKAKYGEQDEEDRERAMAIIGNKPSAVHKAAEEALRIQREAQRGAETGPGGGDDDDMSQGGLSDAEAAAAEEEEELADGTQRVRSGSSAEDDALAKEHEELRRRAANHEDDMARVQERTEREMLNDVPCLSGAPQPGADGVQFAFAVCAPLASVRHYPFKIRVSAGTEKKGAAAKTLAYMFSTAAQTQAVQSTGDDIETAGAVAKAIQQLSVDALISHLPANVKIHAAEARMGAPPPPAPGKRKKGEPEEDPVPPKAGSGQSVRQRARERAEQRQREAEEKLRAEKAALRAEKQRQRELKQPTPRAHVDPAV